MIDRLVCFGDSFTEGEGAWLEKTIEIEKQYNESPEGRLKVAEFNYKYSWPKVLGDCLKAEEIANNGSCGASNERIFNRIFEYDRDKGNINETDLIVVMWSSTIRDKLPFFPSIFQNNGPIGLGWSYKELLDKHYSNVNFITRYNIKEKDKEYLDNVLTPFMDDFFKKFTVNCYDNSYYNLLNFNYIYLLQEFFKFKGCNYIFIDGFESMNSFDANYEKWDLIDKSKYWKFGESTAWDFINNIGGDVFENQELSFNPPGQKCHPNRNGYKLIGEEIASFYNKSC